MRQENKPQTKALYLEHARQEAWYVWHVDATQRRQLGLTEALKLMTTNAERQKSLLLHLVHGKEKRRQK